MKRKRTSKVARLEARIEALELQLAAKDGEIAWLKARPLVMPVEAPSISMPWINTPPPFRPTHWGEVEVSFSGVNGRKIG